MATAKTKTLTWQQIFEKKGLDPKVLPEVSAIPEQYRKPVIAQYILNVVAQFLNGDWKPDYTDYDQYKYFPYFSVKADSKRPSGFGLSYDDFVRWRTDTGCGVRLCYKDRETAKLAGTEYLSLYEDLYLPHQE